MSLSKRALITGASSGIGAALAREYDRRGFSVALLARRVDRIEGLAQSLQRAKAIPCDVCDDASVEAAFEAAEDAFGGLDVVIANAGIGVNGTVESLSLDDFRRQMETNVFGAVRTVKAATPALRVSKGSLALVGSVSGFLSLPGTAAYAMSKFAVRALAEALVGELSPDGISVTHVAPGFVESEIRMVDNAGVYQDGKRDPIPKMFVMSSERAAREIADAIEARRSEVVLTSLGKVATWATRRFPGGIRAATKLASKRIVGVVDPIGKPRGT